MNLRRFTPLARTLGRCAAGAVIRVAAVALLLSVSAVLRAADPPTASPAAAPAGPAVTVDAYLVRLQALDELVASCRADITPAHCPSAQVGPDLELHLASGERAIRLAWLRTLLDRAAGVPPKAAAAKPLANRSLRPVPGEDDRPLPIAEQLDLARHRLGEDRRFAEALGGEAAASGNLSGNQSRAGQARATLAAILAGKDYKSLQAKPTLRQYVLETLEYWVTNILDKLAEAGSRSKWLGITAEIAFILALCLGLAWFLVRLERQGRLSAAAGLAPSSGAASARDWQLWLEDARQAAARSAWRDAIHLLYWASISRLESSGLWPADRARTPREYLALLSPESRQRPTLDQLTRTFERTWYAGRPATQADFQQAEELAARLGASGPQKAAAS